MKVGFIGLGVMGGHMARHLASSHELSVFDVDSSRVAAVVSGGGAAGAAGRAVAAATVTEVAKSADVVLLSLPSSEIVSTVVTGSGGLGESLSEGTAVIDTSTTEPTVSKRIASQLADRGIRFMDAPVSGGEGGARDASLSVMVGGDEAVFTEFKPLLQVIGKSVVRVGEIGAGGAAKLINNMIVAAEFAVIGESFALGKKCGLDPAVLYAAIKDGWAGSAVLNVAAPGIINRDFEPGGSIDILFKDIGYALSLARNNNVPTPMTALADEVFKAARASGRGPKAQQIIIELWEELLGL